MFSCNKIRCLLLVLALSLIFSLTPVFALAADPDPSGQIPTEQEVLVDTSMESTSVAAVAEIQGRINAVLNQYEIAEELSDQQIADAIIAADSETIKTTMAEMAAIEEATISLTEDEFEQLDTELYGRFCAVMEQLFQPAVLATTTTVLDGQVSITDTANKNTVSDGTVTIKATGNLFSKGNNTVTITNKSGSQARLKFNYSVSKHYSFKINDADAAASGVYDQVLDADGTVKLYIQSNSGLSNTTATLTLNNFSLTAVAASSEITFNVDSTYGSITVDGVAVSNGVIKSITSSGAALVATPVTGATFIGWVNIADNSVLSTDASFTLIPSDNMTVRAQFANASSPIWYAVGNIVGATTTAGYNFQDYDPKGDKDNSFTQHTIEPKYLYNDLSSALKQAETTTHKGVLPLNDGTITGNHIIPAGVTLLIPFDSDNTMYTTVPGFAYGYGKALTIDDVYRTITLASGATLTVDGAISLSTPAHSADGTEGAGHPCGNYSKLVMQKGSSIVLNKDSALYAWGYITGDSTGAGTITAESGSTVYENFQFTDYRGGNQSNSMLNKVFAASQYYVHNIEVPLTLKAGATENCCTWVNLTDNYSDTLTTVPFVGSDGLFNISTGSITKSYDGTEDRWHVKFNGEITISSVSLTIGAIPILGITVDVSSQNKVLGVTNNLTLDIDSGTVTVGQDIAMQPGSELIIKEGAKCILNEGVNVYIYDSSNWGNYCLNSSDAPFSPVKFAPSKTYNRTASDIKDVNVRVNGELDASKGYLYSTVGSAADDSDIYTYANIYSTGAGVVKMNSCSDGTTYQYTQFNPENTYHNISVTSAKLLNANTENGTLALYTETATDGAGDYYYHAEHQRWAKDKHEWGEWQETAAPTCTQPGTETRTCSCGVVETQPVATTAHTEVSDPAVDATCTETGLTEGKHCSVCGEVLVAQEEVAALDHTPGTAVEENRVEPSFDAPGSYESVIYCTVCGNEISRTTLPLPRKVAVAEINGQRFETLAAALEAAAEGATIKLLSEPADNPAFNKRVVVDLNSLSYAITCADGWEAVENEDGTQTVQKKGGLFHFYAANVNMGNNLDMMFAFSKSASTDWSGHYVELVRTYSDGTADYTEKIPFENWSSSGNYYVVTYGGFAAKQMCDTITLTVYNADGDAVSYPWKDSMRAYAMRMLGKVTTDIHRTLFVDMLNYGAEAQMHLNYGKDDLANALLSDEHKTWASEAKAVSDTLDAGDYWNGSNVVIKSNIQFMIAFKDLEFTEGMYVTVSYVGHKSNEMTETFTAEDYNKTGYIAINGLVVADARYPVTVTVYDAQKNVITVCEESIEAYVARLAATSPVFEAFMKFADSAHAYKHD